MAAKSKERGEGTEATPSPTGQELLEQVAAEPTLDEIYRRDPRTVDTEERRRVTLLLREERARYIAKDAEKREKE